MSPPIQATSAAPASSVIGLPNAPCSVPAPTDDTRWFEAEVRPHDEDLRNYVRGTFPRLRDIDDVVQESYLRVWKAKASGKIDTARGYLFRIARNVSIDLIRRAGYRVSEPVGESAALSVVDDKATLPGDAAATSEKLEILAAAIDALPPRCREVVILVKLQSKSYREAATQLGLSEKTVAEQLQRAARKLGKELAERGLESMR